MSALAAVRAREARRGRTLVRRRVVSLTMIVLTYGAAALATLPLLLILAHLLTKGASSLSLDLFTHMPRPVGESGGGMANAIVGTLLLVAVGSAIGIPVGVGAGLFMAQRRGSRVAYWVRYLCDVLNGLPSIVIGIFAWEVLVRPVGRFSALAGGIALAVIMIPLAARTTEEMLVVVPRSLSEAALALGYSRWRTSMTVVLRTAMPGIVTGALVAVARIAGETAPLLFTSFGNQFFSWRLDQPIAALPHQIFTYAISPYDSWHTLAWAGSLVLLALVLVIRLAARGATRQRYGRAAD